MDDDPIASVARVSAVPTILRVITEITGLRLSLIAHVTDTTWTCCAVNDQLQFGLEVGGHLDVATTLCAEVRSSRAPIVISHATEDEAYCGHPTPKRYAFESYIAVPIFLRGGEYFGNVCALDSNPVDLSAPRTLAMFQLFAELVGLQIDAEQTAELREEFIAVLGHDLRTPLQAIAMGTDALATRVRPDAEPIVKRMRRSVQRITRLVDDVLDFARGRLGGGIAVQRTPIADVATLFRQVIAELQSIHPGRPIEVITDGECAMEGDPERLSQLLQNLLGNALDHSPPRAKVGVAIRITATHLILSVSNGGPALPPQVMSRMFEPYQRGTSTAPAGLGLGLYIASQIVRSHRGTIAIESTDEATTLTCTLPR